MNPDTINAIKEALQPIAEKIGQGAQYGWEIVVRQQYVTGAEGVALALGGLVLVLIGGFVSKKMWNGTANWSGDGYDNTNPIMISVLLGITGIFIFSIGVDLAITRFLNPAYYALDFFIHLGSSTQ